MNDFFTWNFRGQLISINSVNFPYEWICPKKNLKIPPSKLCGKSIWLILADNGKSYIFGHLVAEKLDSVNHGNYVHYILTADNRVSFRLLPRDKDNWHDWRFPRNGGMGISAVSDSDAGQISVILGRNKQVLSPRRKQRNPKINIYSANDIEASYCRALSENSYGDLAWERNRAATPYASVLSLEKCRSVPEAEKHLREADSKILHILQKGFAKPPQSRKTVFVDTVLRPADLSNMRPRKFIAGEQSHIFSMDKTQIAEEAHQQIVQNLHRFFTARKISSLFSRSVDLAVEIFGKLFIFEIKSASKENFESQAKSGLIQILEYKLWMTRQTAKKVSPVLVISSVSSDDRENYIKTLAESLKVAVVFYSPRRNIQDRFTGLDEILTKN